jgi:DNA-directed RNA polymerase subunit F
MNIISEQLVTDAESKEMLEKREKEAELKYEQKNTMEVLRKFVTVDPAKINALVNELKAVEKLREKQIIAIVNLLPEDKDDLRAVLGKEYNSFTPEEADKILEIVRKTI